MTTNSEIKSLIKYKMQHMRRIRRRWTSKIAIIFLCSTFSRWSWSSSIDALLSTYIILSQADRERFLCAFDKKNFSPNVIDNRHSTNCEFSFFLAMNSTLSENFSLRIFFLVFIYFPRYSSSSSLKWENFCSFVRRGSSSIHNWNENLLIHNL